MYAIDLTPMEFQMARDIISLTSEGGDLEHYMMSLSPSADIIFESVKRKFDIERKIKWEDKLEAQASKTGTK